LLIVMAGLPGTGKSTLAARLAEVLGGVVLSKDAVRAALFPAPVLDYSAAQDHVAMSAVYSAAEYILKADSARPVFIDGRTFSKPGQLDAPLALAAELGEPLRVIECVCADEIACGNTSRGKPHAGAFHAREGARGADRSSAPHARHRRAAV
jgi:predicted kinase